MKLGEAGSMEYVHILYDNLRTLSEQENGCVNTSYNIITKQVSSNENIDIVHSRQLLGAENACYLLTNFGQPHC